jgi:undecaprenyl-diphosphatase
MNILESIIIGIVQGIAEWLPISSKTQVLLVSSVLFGLPVSIAYTYGLFMEIGSVGSAIFYFKKDIIDIFKNKLLFLYLLIITIFTGIVGVPLYILSSKLLEGSYPIWSPMFILGIILILDSIYIYYSRKKFNYKISKLEDMSIRHFILIGIIQGISALPGVSRSGITISTMLILGVKPDLAFRLSYLAYIPAAIGAFSATILLSKTSLDLIYANMDPLGIVIAILSSFIVGLFVINYLLKFAKSKSVYLVTFLIGVIAILSSLIILFNNVSLD